MNLVSSLEQQNLKKQVPDVRPGDRVKVHMRIIEGDKERIQIFQGVVMRKRRGGLQKSITVRRIASHGVGVERTFLVNSPRVEKIEVLSHAHVRRAQLYYLRGRSGKAARLREVRMSETAETAEQVE